MLRCMPHRGDLSPLNLCIRHKTTAPEPAWFRCGRCLCDRVFGSCPMFPMARRRPEEPERHTSCGDRSVGNHVFRKGILPSANIMFSSRFSAPGAMKTASHDLPPLCFCILPFCFRKNNHSSENQSVCCGGKWKQILRDTRNSLIFSRPWWKQTSPVPSACFHCRGTKIPPFGGVEAKMRINSLIFRGLKIRFSCCFHLLPHRND